jgi:hypothetical protein
MVSFEYTPWKSDIKFELCSTAYCFELKDREHRIHVYLSESDGKVSTTLVIDLQKRSGYEKYVKKMVEFNTPDLRLEDHQRLYGLYEHSANLFTLGGYANVLVEWDEEATTVRATVILQKDRIYTSVKAHTGPHHIFYQAQIDGDAAVNEYSGWLRHFLTNSARLLWLLKEYSRAENSD